MSTYYVSNTGNDSNNGTSTGTPWQTLTNVFNNSFNPGDSILFERGGYWNGNNSAYLYIWHGGTEQSPITYGAYGTGDQPIIDRRGDVKTYVNSNGGWTNMGSNIWKGFYDADSKRLWINDTEYIRRNVTGLTESQSYSWVSNYVYVYSTVDPNTYTKIETIYGSTACCIGQSVHNIILENLDIRGGSCIVLRGCDNWIIQNCTIGYNSSHGIWGYANVGVHETCNNVIVRNCMFDTNMTFMNNWQAESTYEGIAIYYGCNNWQVYNNYFKNWLHAGVSLQCLTSGYTVSNNVVHDNYVTAPDIDYGRPFLYNGFKGTMTNNEVYNNVFYNFSIQIQLSGEYLKFHNNIVDTTFPNPWRTGDGTCISIGGNGNESLYGRYIEVYNNTIANSIDKGIAFWYGFDVPNSQYNIVKNNIIYNCGLNHTYDCALWISSNYISNRYNTFQNNIIYTSGVTNIAYFGTGYYMSISELNSMNGISGWTISGNIQLDPSLESPNLQDFRLKSNSIAINAGLDVGLPYTGSAPDIGANEYGSIYFDSIYGNDAGSGTTTSPYKSLTKLNSVLSTVATGTTIYLKRGSEWYGTITPTKSGTSTNPIIIDAYGTGENPIISGFETITGWTQSGLTGIYYKTLSGVESSPQIVLFNGINTLKGHFPNTGWMTIDAFTGHTSISDSHLNSSLTGWTGAELVIRKNHWTIDRNIITNHVGQKLTYIGGSVYDAHVGYGYFIQNDLKCLNDLGDWMFNSGTNTFYMYFGQNSPTNYVVKVSKLNNLYNSGIYDNITLNNITFNGSNTAAILLSSGSSGSTITNCIIDSVGGSGIYGEGSTYITTNYNTTTNVNSHGIYFDPNCHYFNVSYNIFNNIGIMAGLGEVRGQIGTATHVRDNSIVEHNTITNMGYLGIEFDGDNILIENNFINYFCLLMDDGGGIYTYDNQSINKIIRNNIISNGIGNSSGTDDPTYYPANGIYLDDKTQNVIISGNTIFDCANYGIFNHNASNCNISNNIIYNCLRQIYSSNDDVATTVRNLIVKYNTFLSKTSIQYSFESFAIGTDIPLFFDSNYNYILRPIDDTTTIKTRINGWGAGTQVDFRTLLDWQSYSNQDANSHQSPMTISNTNQLRFEYNSGQTNRVVNLDQSYMTMSGDLVSDTISLEPYTSILLIVTNVMKKTASLNGRLLRVNGKVIRIN